jgi:hypothetical protein
MERRVAAIERVDVAHQPLQAAMLRALQEMPVERAVVVPLALLAELAAHEQEFLARMRPHEAEIGAQVCELLPAVAGHLGEQRALPVHDLVMAER